MSYGTSCSGLPFWPKAMATPPTAWQISTPTTTSDSHFICRRSRWSPCRYRSTIEVTAGISSGTNSTLRAFRVPSRATGRRARIASGFA